MNRLGLCIYGETCAGKSTVGKFLGSVIACRYISFGDLKRDEIARGSDVGLAIQEIVASGKPIPAELGFKVFETEIGEGLSIFSGYPISMDELSLLSSQVKIIGIISLSVDEHELVRRFNLRRECPVCHVPGVEGNSCSEHGIAMVRRPDVSAAELVARRQLYIKRITPYLQSSQIQALPQLLLNTSTLSVDEVAHQTEVWIKKLLTLNGG